MYLIKNNLLLLTTFLIVFMLGCNFTSEPNEKQVEFANELVGQKGITVTEWSNNLSLRVFVDLNSLGLNPKMQAQLLADEVASAGFQYTNRSISANIYYGNRNKLADSCLYK